LQGKLPFGNQPLDGRQRYTAKQHREVKAALVSDGNCQHTGPQLGKKGLQQVSGDERHVAGKEQNGFRLSPAKSGVNAAERTAARDGIASLDLDFQSGRFGDLARSRQERLALELQPSLVLAHPGTQAACQDARANHPCSFL
jgi:hypothetical protein